MGLASCDKLTPNGTPETITMLRAGSERACVASDVQQTLRGLIIPKVADLGADGDQTEAQAAVGTVSMVCDTTTLQAADKSVSRATCNTVARIEGANGRSERFPITYEVSPSADHPDSVVVSGNTDDARAFARSEIGDAMAHQTAAKAQQDEAQQQQQARQKLLATVTPKWLIGTWIAPSEPAANCSNGTGLKFSADRSVVGRVLSGQWTLNDGQLHVIASEPSGPFDKTLTITTADAISFDYEGDFRGTLRRCTGDEVNPATENTAAPSARASPEPTAPN